MYHFGTISSGQCGWHVVNRLTDGDSYAGAFACSVDPQVLDGGLYYGTASSGLRQFVPDYVHSGDPDDIPQASIPPESDRSDGDTLLETPECPAADGESGPQYFRFGPDGKIAYRCPDGVWYDYGNDAVLYVGNGEGNVGFAEIQHLGYDNLALFGVKHDRIMRLPDGEFHAVTPLPLDIVAVRAQPSGFHVVSRTTPDSLDNLELWNIDEVGIATLLGSYPEADSRAWPGTHALMLDDTLYSLANADGDDVVVRRTLDGLNEVVYREDEHFVKIHVSQLLTGP